MQSILRMSSLMKYVCTFLSLTVYGQTRSGVQGPASVQPYFTESRGRITGTDVKQVCFLHTFLSFKLCKLMLARLTLEAMLLCWTDFDLHLTLLRADLHLSLVIACACWLVHLDVLSLRPQTNTTSASARDSARLATRR